MSEDENKKKQLGFKPAGINFFKEMQKEIESSNFVPVKQPDFSIPALWGDFSLGSVLHFNTKCVLDGVELKIMEKALKNLDKSMLNATINVEKLSNTLNLTNKKEKSKIMKLDYFEVLEKEILSELAEKLKTYETPVLSVSMKNPDNVWRLSSAMQKCIRRGYLDLAVKYATAMFNGGAEKYLWSRLPVIALEDVGLANTKLCAQVLAVSRSLANRKDLGTKKALLYLVGEMAVGVKSRILCDIMCISENHPSKIKFENAAELSFVPFFDLSPSNLPPNIGMNLIHNAINCKKQLGLLEEKQGQNELMVFDTLKSCQDNYIAYAVYAASKRNVYGLHAPLLYLRNYQGVGSEGHIMPEHNMIGGIVDFAFDQHCLEGKKAIAYWNKSDPVLKKLNLSDPIKKIGTVLFRVEGALLNAVFDPALASRLTAADEDLECVQGGMTEYERQLILERIEEGREHLFHARMKVVSG